MRMRIFWSVILGCVICCRAAEDVLCSLRVSTYPEGAAISVDHKARGFTPMTVGGLTEGEHLVRLSKEGFQDHFETVSLTAGRSGEVSCQMEPVRGLLLVTSEPAGADVTAGGLSLGKTPLFVTTLPSGKNRLKVSSTGYISKEITVTLEGRSPAKEHVVLSSDSGTLSIDSDPTGAEVTVNGLPRGTTPCRVSRISGISVLELRAEGYKPVKREISLSPGEVRDVRIPLEPMPGTLRIVSIPEGARVYVNDEFMGESPYTLADAKPGTYRVRLDLKGCDSNARDITIEKGATLTEEFRMVKNTGHLEIFTSPSGAMVMLNGKKRGITMTRKSDISQMSDPLRLNDLVEGEYELEVVKKGYAKISRKITVTREKTLPLQLKLERLFIPDYEVITIRRTYRGMLSDRTEEGIRIETSPGILETIPMKDVKKHGYLKQTE
ncbi:MAG: PEGA domain-containing protein [Kiritimatiellae bacterium]|nr:PEGA domain-containing protein [Kiritimatiellia bacterium]